MIDGAGGGAGGGAGYRRKSHRPRPRLPELQRAFLEGRRGEEGGEPGLDRKEDGGSRAESGEQKERVGVRIRLLKVQIA